MTATVIEPGFSEGDRLRDESFDALNAGAYKRRFNLSVKVAVVGHLLEHGECTSDDARCLCPLPSKWINPKAFGAVFAGLSRDGLIELVSYAKTARPEAHARSVGRWRLKDRGKAVEWLAHYQKQSGQQEPPPQNDKPRRSRQGQLAGFA